MTSPRPLFLHKKPAQKFTKKKKKKKKDEKENRERNRDGD
jgi:hypothetical protein